MARESGPCTSLARLVHQFTVIVMTLLLVGYSIYLVIGVARQGAVPTNQNLYPSTPGNSTFSSTTPSVAKTTTTRFATTSSTPTPQNIYKPTPPKVTDSLGKKTNDSLPSLVNDRASQGVPTNGSGATTPGSRTSSSTTPVPTTSSSPQPATPNVKNQSDLLGEKTDTVTTFILVELALAHQLLGIHGVRGPMPGMSTLSYGILSIIPGGLTLYIGGTLGRVAFVFYLVALISNLVFIGGALVEGTEDDYEESSCISDQLCCCCVDD